MGRRATAEEEINVSLETLEDLNVQCYKIDRGGHATLHSPGQLVIYPVLKLSDYNLSVREYLCLLQKTTLNFMKKFGIDAFNKDESPGIFTSKGKIAFFGIRVRMGIAFHGISINVSNQVEDFSLIRSCGIDNETFDQMKDYDVNSSLEQLFSCWVEEFKCQF